MATQSGYVASILVANLSTATRYVDHFVVELYSDAGLTTLVQSQTCSVVWNGTSTNQVGAIVFNGLTQGATYYLRAGVVAPTSGVTTWSSTYTEVAGSAPSAIATTYSGTFTGTISGVNYTVIPASVPTNLLRYEAVWTKDGTTPANTVHPNLQMSSVQSDGSFHFFAGGVPGESITAFVRAITIDVGGQQDWQSLGTIAVATSGTFSGTFAGSIADTTTINGKPIKAVGDAQTLNINSETDSTLDYGRHAAAVTTGLTTSGNFQSGKLLGGDGGVATYGSGSLLGFGGSPSSGSELAVFGTGQLLTQGGAGATFFATDTAAGGVPAYWQSNAGIIAEFLNGGQRRWVTGNGYGIGGSPSYALDILGGGSTRISGSSPLFMSNDTGASGVTGEWQSSGGNLAEYRSGQPRRYVSGVGHGFDMTPSGASTLETNGHVRSTGGAAFRLNDTSAGGVESYFYSGGGVPTISRAGTDRVITNAAGTGVDMTPTFGFDVSSVAARMVGTAPYWLTDDSTTGGVRAQFGSGGAVTGEVGMIRDGVYRLRVNGTGTGIDRAPSTYMVEAAGSFAAQATSPVFIGNDTAPSGLSSVLQSVGGMAGVGLNGHTLAYLNNTGMGVGGTPTSSTIGLEVFSATGGIRATGSNAGLYASDRDTSGVQAALYSNGGKFALNHNGYGDVLIGDGAGRVGLDGTAANNPLEVYGSGSQLLAGSNAGYFHYDRTTAGQYYGLYGNAGAHLLWDSIYGSTVQAASGKVGIGTTVGAYPLAAAGDIQAIGPQAALRSNDTSAGGTEWVWHSVNGSMNAWNGNDHAYFTPAGELGIGRVPVSYGIEVNGTIQVGNGSNAQFRAYDTGGANESVWYESAGLGRQWRDGADRVYQNATGTGYSRTPQTYLLESSGDIQAVGSGVTLRVLDTGSNTEAWMHNTGGYPRLTRTTTGDLMQFDTANHVGFFGAPSTEPISIQGAHIFDKISAAGTTYGLLPNANVSSHGTSSARALIDATQSHVNWNQDNFPDGSNFKRLKYVNTDNTLHVSTPLNNLGGLIQANAGGIFSYNNQVVSPYHTYITWTAGTIPARDGSSISLAANSTGVPLSLNQNYTNYVQAYYDMDTSAVVFYVSDMGSPAGTAPCSSSFQATVLLADRHIPLLYDWQVFVPTGGGGSGGGGGGVPGGGSGGGGRTLL